MKRPQRKKPRLTEQEKQRRHERALVEITALARVATAVINAVLGGEAFDNLRGLLPPPQSRKLLAQQSDADVKDETAKPAA